MGTTVSLSSPEPEERNLVERAWHILTQKPLRMGSMLRLSRLMNDAAPHEKLVLLSAGVLQKLLDMIDERSNLGSAATAKATSQPTGHNPAQKGAAASALQHSQHVTQAQNQNQKSPAKGGRNNFVTQITTSRRKSNAYSITHRGIGYGFGSTRSQWDIERTIEEQMVREEQMVWLMNALMAYLVCASPDFSDPDNVVEQARERDCAHINSELVSLIENSTIVPMLEYHLKNESIFDISEHMEFYQALLETACCMALFPSLIELLLYHPLTNSAQTSGSSQECSAALYLLPRFRDQLLTYLTSPAARTGSPDFRLIDFIQRVQKWSTIVTLAGRAVVASSQQENNYQSKRINSSNSKHLISINTPFKTTMNSIPNAMNNVNGTSLSTSASIQQSESHAHTPHSDDSPTELLLGATCETLVSDGIISNSSSAATVASSTSFSMEKNVNNASPNTGKVGKMDHVINSGAETDAETGAAATSASGAFVNINGTKRAVDYTNSFKPLQINTWKFIGDFGKLVVPFTYRKEAKSLNPFSPSLKERTKRIARELASLHNALPLNWSNSIFIAVDEGRCDIMKVLITGPEDTPYQNGCFEFDLFFPSSYPFSPPKVTFLTTNNGEVRFNPNLYQDGKVCLSILNTWEGRPEEKWNPYCSLLQLLVSVQALIFVKEPYFNEPGFERYMGTEKGQHLSSTYNQQLQHATLHYAILEQLRQPPEYFRDVIRRHLYLKKEAIIEQAQQWLRTAQADMLMYAKEKDNKKGGGGTSSSAVAAAAAALDSGLGVVSVRSMERTVEMLVQELTQLQCPD